MTHSGGTCSTASGGFIDSPCRQGSGDGVLRSLEEEDTGRLPETDVGRQEAQVGFRAFRSAGRRVYCGVAVEELGLMESPLRDLCANFQGQLPFEHPLAPQDFKVWVDTLYGVIADTREWLSVAQRRTELLNGRVGWKWTYNFAPVTDHQVGLLPQWPVESARNNVPQVSLDRVPAPSVSVTELLAALQVESTNMTMMSHPTMGPGAANSVVPYSPRTSLGNRVSTSTALIPHPIYGPGAQNALVRYHPTTPWANRDDNPRVPPNSLSRLLLLLPSDSETDVFSYYSFEIEEESDSDDSDEEGVDPRVPRGEAPDFPIYVESDSEDDVEDDD
ncbi:hypothetical protein NUW54_g3455 [Trametes sanguinea]|uniref:Uncharacterized protein n=1 Tax=Trametes sanguinea TaxID=158606 RepID=A0ACC1Q2C9_9APHY|nr:hypothetical protein NUW54_g3455 [Trametes sanguinea]